MALVTEQMAAQEAKNLEDERKRREKERQIRHSIAQYQNRKEEERRKELAAHEKRVGEVRAAMKQQAKKAKER